MSRVVCWFSCGVTSAVATKLSLNRFLSGGFGSEFAEFRVVYCDTRSEHPDNARFMRDVEAWLGQKVEVIGSADYQDTWDVFEKTRWLVGPDGARCTAELKKIPRFAYQKPGDLHVFGFDASEVDRYARFREDNHDIQSVAPLIEAGLSKPDCLTLVERAGIKVPEMYLLGFNNANCVGCVKGGMGYWNKIRRIFPEVFDRMAKLERTIGAAICRKRVPGGRIPVYLDELDPDAGKDKAVVPDCSAFCARAQSELGEEA